MCVVAIGHWLGMVFVLDSDGEIVAGNALEMIPSLWGATWVGQVMPLFFFVGGFSSARSILAAGRNGVADSTWVANRLRRMIKPAVALAATWAALLVIGPVVGQKEIVFAGAIAAAIPLWFLANYTIDTAIAPTVLRHFRRNPRRVVGIAGAVFLVVEVANFAGVGYVPHINWGLGWMLFQLLGFAWSDGLLPSGRALWTVALATWAAAIAAVGFGPWPAAMLHHGGLEHSPTHPPSLAFVLFGMAYSLTAAALAPRINRWLEGSPRAWRRVIAANGVAMSVYLWHMTAAVIVLGTIHLTGHTPRVAVGSTQWWLWKIPVVSLSSLVLAVIVRKVSAIEVAALTAPSEPWTASKAAVICWALALSAGIKAWSSPTPQVLAAGIALLLISWSIGRRFGFGADQG